MNKNLKQYGLKNPIISPLDFLDRKDVVRHLDLVGPHVGLVKLGSQVFKSLGEIEVVKLIHERGLSVMWDEKFADIPSQVGNAVKGVSSHITPVLLTVHASAGSETIKAAVANASPGTMITCISVLTSISKAECSRIYGSHRSVEEVVRDLALLAVEAGAKALVCSPQELRYLKDQERLYPELGNLCMIVPSIKASDSPPDDQARKATPFEAGAWGADMIVVGRLISGAPDPAAKAQEVTAEFLAGVKTR